MTKGMVINSWKNPYDRTAKAPANPAGDIMVELNDAELDQVVGAGVEAQADSSGVVCTITTECSIWPGC